MTKLLFILLFSNILFSNQWYMNCGLSLNPSGLEMGMFHIPKESGSFTITGGYGWLNLDSNSNNDGYEDYTETLGTTNTFNDRFDGQFSITDVTGLGIYFYSPMKKYFLITQLGLINYNKSYFNKYYDSYQILGNNGKYYSESSTPSEKSISMEVGINLAYEFISQNPYWKPIGYIGFSLSKFYSPTMRIGVALTLG